MQKMICCKDMGDAMDREILTKSEVYQIQDGRVLNEIDTEYFIRAGDTSGNFSYLGVNYCPFCGRALSRGLWAAEKKK
jgi:hypothetical protein